MNVNNIHNIYFLGIGGIGMSALARYFNSVGKTVGGYDRQKTDLTTKLSNEGIHVHYDALTENIPLVFTHIDTTLVIYTPAVPATNEELCYFREKGFTLMKRAEALGILTLDNLVIAVAGTHGKSTVSTMIAHVLRTANIPCTAFLGSISKNYNTNLLLNTNTEESNSEHGNYIVAEADEYDRSFLHLFPYLAVITSIDADHLDIYGTTENYASAFEEFAGNIKPEGLLLLKKSILLDLSKNTTVRKYSYDLHGPADFYVENLVLSEGCYTFDFVGPWIRIDGITSGIPGLYNIENALAALATGVLLNIEPILLKKAINSFAGLKRRFDYQVHTDSLTYIDDYAHHPEEIRACIVSARALFPGKKITGVFQPHLFSRTMDMFEEFASSLSLLDELILLDIYPAREKPVPGVTSQIIFDKVTLDHKFLCKKENLIDKLDSKNIEILITMGAGDIDQLVDPLRDKLLINILQLLLK